MAAVWFLRMISTQIIVGARILSPFSERELLFVTGKSRDPSELSSIFINHELIHGV